MPPRVSVLVPARDAAATLASALASVRVQTESDHELVLVDDGSEDSTAAIAAGVARGDSRVRVVRGPRAGIVAALQRGLAECRGRYVARFDADDLMHRDRLRRQCDALDAEPELAGVGALVRCFPRVSMRDGLRRYETWLNSVCDAEAVTRERFVEAPLVHPSVTMRRDRLEALGGWRDVPWPEDWDLWLRALEAGDRFRKIAAVLHFWRDGASRLTRTDARYSAEALVRARAHFLARGPLARRAALVWGAGPVGKALAYALQAEGVVLRAFVEIDPRKIGQRVADVPVIAASALPAPGPSVLLAAVGAAGARDEIRSAARAGGYVEGRDFFACA
jgi:glycosyltransferase involved in cell wall biosynthesis